MSVIEHTLNILIFPGLHSDSRGTENFYGDLVDATSSMSIGTNVGLHPHASQPYLSVPGLKKLCLPSPLHLKLHVLTRLSFNEQGRITRHRDFWDVRDVIGLVPGMTVAQWIGTRVAAQGISFATKVASWIFGGRKGEEDCERGHSPGAVSTVSSEGEGRHPANASMSAQQNALGLELHDGERSRHGHVGQRRPLSWNPQRDVTQAPDVDRDSGS